MVENSTPRPGFIELPTRDLAVGRAFYLGVFGWDMTSFGPSYACTMTGDVDVGLQADASEATHAPLPVIERRKEDGTIEKVIVVDPEYVRQQVAGIVKNQDLSRYIL